MERKGGRPWSSRPEPLQIEDTRKCKEEKGRERRKGGERGKDEGRGGSRREGRI